MIKVLKEKFKNLPSWLKPYMKQVTRSLDNKGIDLYNAEYEDASDIKPRDPRWKTGGILTVLLQDPKSGKSQLYMWGYDKPESDPLMSDGKWASQHSKSWIIDNAIHIGFIKKNKKPKKDRYQDPRYDNKGNYAGQTYYDYTRRYGYNPEEMPPGEWFSKHGRDKSGYVIPDPAKLISKLYKFNVDNTAEVLDNYYKKISRIRDKIFKIDFRNMQDKGINGWNDDYSELLSSLANVTNSYVRLEKAVNKALTRISTKASDNDLNLDEYAKARGYTTTDELFQDILDWEGKYQVDLDKYLYDIQSKLKKVNS